MRSNKSKSMKNKKINIKDLRNIIYSMSNPYACKYISSIDKLLHEYINYIDCTISTLKYDGKVIYRGSTCYMKAVNKVLGFIKDDIDISDPTKNLSDPDKDCRRGAATKILIMILEKILDISITEEFLEKVFDELKIDPILVSPDKKVRLMYSLVCLFVPTVIPKENFGCLRLFEVFIHHSTINNSTTELVNHPNHYNLPGRKECLVEMLDYFGSDALYHFCILSAYKYLYRAGNKGDNPEEQDIKKAKFYIDYGNNLKVDGSQDLMEAFKKSLKDNNVDIDFDIH